MPGTAHTRYSLRAGILALAAACAACGTESPVAFQLTGLDVNRAAVSLETPAVLSGAGIFAAASVDLDTAEAELDASFHVFVGDFELGADAATRVDSETLTVVFPVGLPVGLRSVKVVAPSGAEAVLADALLVAEPVLHIEDAADGSGSVVETQQLAIGNSLELFALSRWPDGLFFRSEEADWVLTGLGDTFEVTSTSLLVTAIGVDTQSVVAQSELFGSAEAEIQSAQCFAATDCSDGCRSTNACTAGLCVIGPIDKDSDGDGFIDAACGGDDCADELSGDPACNGLPGALCHPGLAGADSCDGADNDCDNSLDEDHVASATSCGLGACAGNLGVLSCSAGTVVDTCDALAGAAADDATCNNINDDCDAATDEDYLATATSCGIGACAGNAGTLSCVVGIETDNCDPLAGAAADDATCNNINDDCDGATDEDFGGASTICGIGACAGNSGTLSCVVGVETDSCDPLAGAAPDDASCNNVNDDCDGATDEDYLVTATSCGLGACAGNTGTLSCVVGVETDNCDPLAGAAADDATCNNVNEDCDGATDEDYLIVATSCGVGACAGNAGTSSCISGVESDDCDPLAGAAADDSTCDGVDDDCDALFDENPPLTWFADADGDTYGDAASTLKACLQPLNFVFNSLDCADTPGSDPLCGGLDGSFCNPDISEGPDGDASCTDGVDNDCNGSIDAADSGCAPAGFVASNVDPASFTPLVAIDLTGCSSPVGFDSTTLTYSGNWCGPQPVPVVVNAGGVDVVVLPMHALTVPDGILKFTGDKAIIALVYGDVDIAFGIDVGANRSTPGPGGSSPTLCASGQGSQGESGGSRAGGGGGGGFGNIGGIGGTGQGTTFAGGNPGGLEGNPAMIPLRGGCGGGDGGIPATGGSAPGGAGGGALQISASGNISISGRINGGGGGGSRGNPRRVGGGGGGSGGSVLLEAAIISVTGHVLADGGAGGGGNGSNTGAATHGEDSTPSLIAAAGGIGFETGGDGGDGSLEPINTGNPGEDDGGSGGGGGGGGGGGRIRLNAGTSCQVGTATLSPQPTSNAAPGCP